MKCPKHPTYKAMHPPRCVCECCYKIWRSKSTNSGHTSMSQRAKFTPYSNAVPAPWTSRLPDTEKLTSQQQLLLHSVSQHLSFALELLKQFGETRSSILEIQRRLLVTNFSVRGILLSALGPIPGQQNVKLDSNVNSASASSRKRRTPATVARTASTKLKKRKKRGTTGTSGFIPTLG